MEQAELVEGFLNTFQLLTPKQQKIWRYLQSFARQYRNVYPSHHNIAKACDCHRDTVIQAINRFKKFGWISVIKRAYRSCVYFLADVLVEIDTWKPNTFRKKNLSDQSDNCPTSNPTILDKNKYESIKNENVENESVQKLTKEGIHFSQEDVCILTRMARNNPEAMNKALVDYRSLAQKEKVLNPAALLTSRCKFHASQRGESVPREISHLDLKERDKIALAKLNQADRQAFLFAYEDYKTYSIFRRVGNVAAFIVSRFKAYLKGEENKQRAETSNHEKMKQLLEKCTLPKHVDVQFFNSIIEISSGTWFKAIEIEGKDSLSKFRSVLRRLGADL